MSFFICALKQGASQDPDNRDVEQLGLISLMRLVLSLAHPDYRDHDDAFIKGHE
jgi:hypothetical protein